MQLNTRQLQVTDSQNELVRKDLANEVAAEDDKCQGSETNGSHTKHLAASNGKET